MLPDDRGHLQIDVLGVSFAIEADEHSEYLEGIYQHYKQVLNDVEETSGMTDPLKIAIITGVLLADEVAKGRNGTAASEFAQKIAHVEQSTKKMIDAIDSVMYSV